MNQAFTAGEDFRGYCSPLANTQIREVYQVVYLGLGFAWILGLQILINPLYYEKG